MTNGDCQILVVEDCPKTALLISVTLKGDSFRIFRADCGQAALEIIDRERIDMLILDLGLPDMDGLDVLKALRDRESNTPVLILSAREAVEDRVRGLDSGADDYLIKPFQVPELQARVRTLLRRVAVNEKAEMKCGDLVLNMNSKTLRRNGEEVELAPKELLLVEYFLKHKGEVISRSMLARDVWKYNARTTSMDNIIDVQMSRLRDKIDKGYPKRLLHTVRGVGFTMREPD